MSKKTNDIIRISPVAQSSHTNMAFPLINIMQIISTESFTLNLSNPHHITIFCTCCSFNNTIKWDSEQWSVGFSWHAVHVLETPVNAKSFPKYDPVMASGIDLNGIWWPCMYCGLDVKGMLECVDVIVCLVVAEIQGYFYVVINVGENCAKLYYSSVHFIIQYSDRWLEKIWTSVVWLT